VPPTHTTINQNPQVSWQSRGFHVVASQQRKIQAKSTRSFQSTRMFL